MITFNTVELIFDSWANWKWRSNNYIEWEINNTPTIIGIFLKPFTHWNKFFENYKVIIFFWVWHLRINFWIIKMRWIRPFNITLQNNSKTLLNIKRSLYLEIASKKYITLYSKSVFFNLWASTLLFVGVSRKFWSLCKTFLTLFLLASH